MRISDWSSDVCSSDLSRARHGRRLTEVGDRQPRLEVEQQSLRRLLADAGHEAQRGEVVLGEDPGQGRRGVDRQDRQGEGGADAVRADQRLEAHALVLGGEAVERSEEHTSELQSLMRISYAVFCLQKKKNKIQALHI